MTARNDPPVVHFDAHVAHVGRDRSIAIAPAPPGPPQRIDGYSLGAVTVPKGPGPHGGEVHPDGDETTVVLRAGDACVVPREVWHRLVAVEPSMLVHVTPGPNGGHRPLPPPGVG
jgi:quercetin dioxygenase-like cupin family protein